jgi:hypothetical protein
MFLKISSYCHGTKDFISQIHENMELDMSINNNKEKFFDGLVDDKMKSFLKKFIFPQNSTGITQNLKQGSFDIIFEKYKIDLKNLFPNLTTFTYSHEAMFLFQSMSKFIFSRKPGFLYRV